MSEIQNGSLCVKESPSLHVLELITVPLFYNGLTLFPLRSVRQMPDVAADFLSYGEADPGLMRDLEEAGCRVFIAPHRLKHPLAYLRYVRKVIREHHYDAVHCHGNSCTLSLDLLAARLGGAKVRIAHSHNTSCKSPALHRLLRPLFNHLYTHAMACGVEAGHWLFGRRPFTVVRNAIETSLFAFHEDVRKRVRSEFHCESAIVLGCVCNFTAAKNPSFLLNVFAQAYEHNPALLLMLVGDGPLRAETEQLARDLNIESAVRFLGMRTDVPDLLQMMDAMLLPSLHEGFPTVALEWQCAGLPTYLANTITRDCAFIDEVTFLPLDMDAWVDALLTLPMADRAEVSARGIAALSAAGYDLQSASLQLRRDYEIYTGKRSS